MDIGTLTTDVGFVRNNDVSRMPVVSGGEQIAGICLREFPVSDGNLSGTVESITILAECVETKACEGSIALARRPELRAALDAARQAKCPVVVDKLDGLSRDVAVVSALMAQQVPFLVAELGAEDCDMCPP